jgi:hypothetical protein
MAVSSKVIKGTDYLSIATYYSNARTSNLESVDFLYDAVYQLVLSTQLYTSVDLINEFFNSYQINYDIFRSPSTYLPAVRAINSHVLNRAGATVSDLNDYLDEENITVPLGWAELCKATGVLICQSNIDGSPTVFEDGTAVPSCD